MYRIARARPGLLELPGCQERLGRVQMHVDGIPNAATLLVVQALMFGHQRLKRLGDRNPAQGPAKVEPSQHLDRFGATSLRERRPCGGDDIDGNSFVGVLARHLDGRRLAGAGDFEPWIFNESTRRRPGGEFGLGGVESRPIMRTSAALTVVALVSVFSTGTPGRISQVRAAAPIALHPANPHYFEWRGRPAILITSGEHYGAVMNLDFDYRKYLDTLAADGMNYTRVFSGAYLEPQGAFKIERNTLAPRPGRFLAPWPRSSQPGHPDGGNKFDLSRWDDAYFARLKDFLASAAARNVVVELSLFCPMYEEVQWSLSPMNAANNVNGVGAVGRNDVYTLDKDRTLLAVQEALTRKLVTELNAFDNLFFEICQRAVLRRRSPCAWQHRIADVIVETERASACRST